MTARPGSQILLSAQLALAAALVLAGGACTSSSASKGPGCAVAEAEHPAYTTPAGDVVLCGNTYTTANLESACDSHFHVCGESEWHDRYPAGVGPGGTQTSWGAPQADRCTDVWQADQPVSNETWTFDSVDECASAYNPWNSYKALLSDDGTTVLVGDGACCDWDSSFETTSATDDLAVYCCE